MGKRTLYSLESDIRRILEGNDFISTNDESGKQWYMNLVTDLAIFVQQELEKAREEGYQAMFEGLDNIARDSSGDFNEGVAIIKLRNEITRLYNLKDNK